MPPPHQGPRRHAAVKVIVNGLDVTSQLQPHLISVQVIDKITGEVDTCSIELDDRDARLPIPMPRGSVEVSFGWDSTGPRILPVPPVPDAALAARMPQSFGPPRAELPYGGGGMIAVFQGTIEQVESGFSRRGGGRRLWIEATSLDLRSGAKSNGFETMGEGDKGDDADKGGQQQIPFQQAAQQMMGKMFNVIVGPEFGKNKRDFWQKDESPMSWGQRMATELGGFMKVAGGSVLFATANDLKNMNFPVIQVWWGINLISWRIKPFVGRSEYESGRNNFFDIAQGMWQNTVKQFTHNTPFGTADAQSMLPGSAPNRQTGGQNNEGQRATTRGGESVGWVIFNGEPAAKAGGQIMIEGARPGVNGMYLIKECEHNYSRNGYTVRCDLANPELKASEYYQMGWTDTGTAPAPPTPPVEVGIGTSNIPDTEWVILPPPPPPLDLSPPVEATPPTSDEASEAAGAGGITFPDT